MYTKVGKINLNLRSKCLKLNRYEGRNPSEVQWSWGIESKGIALLTLPMLSQKGSFAKLQPWLQLWREEGRCIVCSISVHKYRQKCGNACVCSYAAHSACFAHTQTFHALHDITVYMWQYWYANIHQTDFSLNQFTDIVH